MADWNLAQSFGEKSKHSENEDIISALDFEPSTGNYLAIGDRGGRVIILKRDINNPEVKYNVDVDFQSHEPAFDYLNSLEIEEKINKIRWRKHCAGSLYMLTANDKKIKLWQLKEKKVRKIKKSKSNDSTLQFPKVVDKKKTVLTPECKVYRNAHSFNINSLDFSSDYEQFISSDDLRINLWNLNHKREYLNIIDIKPSNIENLSEVITCSSFHPTESNIFMYSSSKGTTKMFDLREKLKCDDCVQEFHLDEDSKNKTFFSEIIASISDAKFSKDGKYILERDFMTLKVWDRCMSNKPVKVFNIHEPIRAKLLQLYENDCIFDKFTCDWSGDGNHVITGSYKSSFVTIDVNTGKKIDTHVSKKNRSKKQKSLFKLKKKKDYKEADFNKKALHTVWHPKENIACITQSTGLFVYNREKK